MPTLEDLKRQFDQHLQEFKNHVDLFKAHRHRGPAFDQTMPAFPVAYIGHLASGAVADLPFPKGWSSASGGTGIMTITHNLGHTNYSVVAIAAAKVYCQLSSKTSTTFQIKTFNDAGTATASALDFILMSNS